MVAALGLLVSSCGLETVEYLPPPAVQPYSNQSSYDQLPVFSFDPGLYSGIPDFQGFEVFYKIYPESGSGPFTNLAADAGRLETTPTRDYLITLGYQRMNEAYDHATVVPLINLHGAPATTITVNFKLLTDPSAPPSPLGNQPGSPIPTADLGNGSSIPLFRTVSIAGGTITFPYFNELFSPWTARTSDMDSTIQSSTSPYEIDVFIVAYAFSLESTTYSKPIPWGVIGNGLQPLKVH